MATFRIREILKEARRRRVFRVSGMYIVGGFIALQVADLAFPVFGIPEASIRYVWIGLVVGFPVALTFGWLFEVTDGQLRRTHRTDDAVDLGLRSTDYVLLATLAAVAIAIAIGTVGELSDTQSPFVGSDRVASVDPASIAVMPFVNMSDDPDNEYFSDGISEELLNLIAKIPDLRVISRSSSFHFKGKDAALSTVMEQLNVAHLLEGSVRKAGNRVRITAQLVDARTDTQLWSDSYDRKLDDVFAIQGEIAAAIAYALAETMGLQAAEMPDVKAPTNLPAHEAYLRGRYLVAQRTPDAIRGAIREFENAVSLDPGYALAYAELSLATRRLSFFGDLTPAEARSRAAPHAERAMALDPTLAQAHAALGYVWVTPQTMDKAMSHFRKAVQLNPNYSDAHLWLGNFDNGLGIYDEAFVMTEKAARLDPLSRPALYNYAAGLIQRNRLDEADQQLQKLASIDSTYLAAQGLSSYRASVGGRWADGLLKALESLTVSRERPIDYPIDIAFALIGLGEEALAAAEEGAADNYVLSFLGRPHDELARVQARLAENPDSLFTRLELGMALAGTGNYTDARPVLEEFWRLIGGTVSVRGFSTDHALAMIAHRRQAGDEAGVSEMVAAISDNVRRYRKAGITVGDYFWSVDFEEGITSYLSGDRERGLASIARAVQGGYFIRPNLAYLQWLYDDPGFEPIRASQEAMQARERARFLAIVCADNPYAAVWKPADDTCRNFIATGGC